MPQKTTHNIPNTDEWSALAALAQKGDKIAYTRLLKEISFYIRNVLSGTLVDQDWVDDITQDVLISVHKSLNTYGADRPFKPWLRAIISFRKADYLRKHYAARGNKNVDLESSEFLAAHVTNPAHAGELKDIEAQLDRLPKKQRTIFEKMRIYGYTAQEVADELGMSVSAVKVSVHRTQNKLKNH